MKTKSKIIFLIHGLGGTKDKTWGEFPNFLENDERLSDYQIYPLGYDTPLLPFFKRAPNIDNIARGLLDEIVSACAQYDEIIIAGHSLGGILLKKIILVLHAQRSDLNITKICFFDTPHTGSGYANIGSKITWRNRHLKQLVNNAPDLNDLNRQWGDSDLDRKYEVLNFVASNDDIVSSTSSQGHYIGELTKIISNTDHLSIVKPKDENALSYKYFCEFILKKKSIARKLINSSQLPGLKTYKEWGEMQSIRNDVIPYTPIESRNDVSNVLLAELSVSKSICRLEAFAGLGKTRLAYESFSQRSDLQDRIIYVDVAMESVKQSIVAQLSSWIATKEEGILIVDNCEQNLHGLLVEEIQSKGGEFSLLTIDYNKTRISFPTNRFELVQLTNNELKKLLAPIYEDKLPDFEKVIEFSQGFPKLAVLLAEARLDQSHSIGELTDDVLASKLLWGRSELQNKDQVEKVLQFLSLFHAIYLDEDNEEELKFVSDNTINDIDTVYEIVHNYVDRNIIDKRGRYGQLIPTPLAVRLAATWWKKTRTEKKEKIINDMPESMHENFCQQLQKMHWHPEAKEITSSICNRFSSKSFGEADITIRDSRLIRALSYVNPLKVSEIIKSYLEKLNHDEILDLDSTVRREFYWSLERTVFPKESFSNSIYAILFLASAETESYGNNSTNLFKQLFSIYLSGTEVEPKDKQDIFDSLLEKNNKNYNALLLEALERLLKLRDYSRMGGAEEQGWEKPLIDWEPKNTQEIVDYAQWGLQKLMCFIDKAEFSERALLVFIDNFKHYITNSQFDDRLNQCFEKGLQIKQGNWQELERRIIEIKHLNWIENADSNEILLNWENKLKSKSFTFVERLNREIVNPILPDYLSANDTEDLSVISSFAKDIVQNKLEQELYENIGRLLTYEKEYPFKSKSYYLGKKLVENGIDINLLSEKIISFLSKFDGGNSVYLHLDFAKGVYREISETNIINWYEILDEIKITTNMHNYFIEFCFLGKVREADLTHIIEGISKGNIDVNNLRKVIFYILDAQISNSAFSNFIENISAFSIEGKIISIEMSNRYISNNKEILTIPKFQSILRSLIFDVPIIGDVRTNFYEWETLAKFYIRSNSDIKAIYELTNKMLTSYAESKFRSYDEMRKFLQELAKLDNKQVWQAFTAFIDRENIHMFLIKFLLGERISWKQYEADVFSMMPPAEVIQWLRLKADNKKFLRSFAEAMTIFIQEDRLLQLSPLVIPFLIEFGDDSSVRSSVKKMTMFYSNSAVPVLEKELEVVSCYLDHEDKNVRLWAKETEQYLKNSIPLEQRNTDERSLLF